jgi:hypothetical protein
LFHPFDDGDSAGCAKDSGRFQPRARQILEKDHFRAPTMTVQIHQGELMHGRSMRLLQAIAKKSFMSSSNCQAQKSRNHRQVASNSDEMRLAVAGGVSFHSSYGEAVGEYCDTNSANLLRNHRQVASDGGEMRLAARWLRWLSASWTASQLVHSLLPRPVLHLNTASSLHWTRPSRQCMTGLS